MPVRLRKGGEYEIDATSQRINKAIGRAEPLPTGSVRGTKAGTFGVCVKTPYDEAFDPGWNPLTRPAPADEDAVAGHPLPQGREG
jgi:hypothetical protein